MKNKLTIGIVLVLISLKLQGQTATDSDTLKISQLLVGEWVYVKTLDSNNNEVKMVHRNAKCKDCPVENIVAGGPDITVNKNHTYVKKFTQENSDKGHWKLLSNSEVEYEMVIPKNSRQGNLIIQTQQLLGNKWLTDTEGNFLDASVDKILSLDEHEMKVEYEKNYILVYKKK